MAITSGEKRGVRRSMTVLGKISAVPKPINLPSQRSENHGLDPNVEIVPRGSLNWGPVRLPPANSSPSNSAAKNFVAIHKDVQSASVFQPSSGCYGPSLAGLSRPSSAGKEKASSCRNLQMPDLDGSSSTWDILASRPSTAPDASNQGPTHPSVCAEARRQKQIEDVRQMPYFVLRNGDFPVLGSDGLSLCPQKNEIQHQIPDVRGFMDRHGENCWTLDQPLVEIPPFPVLSRGTSSFRAKRADIMPCERDKFYDQHRGKGHAGVLDVGVPLDGYSRSGSVTHPPPNPITCPELLACQENCNNGGQYPPNCLKSFSEQTGLKKNRQWIEESSDKKCGSWVSKDGKSRKGLSAHFNHVNNNECDPVPDNSDGPSDHLNRKMPFVFVGHNNVDDPERDIAIPNGQEAFIKNDNNQCITSVLCKGGLSDSRNKWLSVHQEQGSEDAMILEDKAISDVSRVEDKAVIIAIPSEQCIFGDYLNQDHGFEGRENEIGLTEDLSRTAKREEVDILENMYNLEVDACAAFVDRTKCHSLMQDITEQSLEVSSHAEGSSPETDNERCMQASCAAERKFAPNSSAAIPVILAPAVSSVNVDFTPVVKFSTSKATTLRHPSKDGQKARPSSATSQKWKPKLPSGSASEAQPFSASSPALSETTAGISKMQAKQEVDSILALEAYDYEAQRARMKEMAQQRARQLQKEHEERTKEQKAKALAKLAELNRRTESSTVQENSKAFQITNQK